MAGRKRNPEPLNAIDACATCGKPTHRTIVVDRRQRCAAASAALNVLLGRITAVIFSLSGA
jgi:hypothetical protein